MRAETEPGSSGMFVCNAVLRSAEGVRGTPDPGWAKLRDRGEGVGLSRWVEQPGHGKLNKLMPFLSGVELSITHCIAPHSANRPRANSAAVGVRACRVRGNWNRYNSCDI